MTPEHTRLRYSPSLDGIRAGAVLLVMAHHLGLPVHGGHIGVNVFFVLSGFLITYLLLDERIGRGRVAFGNFYARRALRLYPALIALVVVASLFSVIVPDAYRAENTLNSIPMVLLYLGNWVRAGVTEGSPLGLFEHTWSLSVEEQFYLVWPWLIWLATLWTSRLVVVVGLAIAGIVSSLFLRLVVFPGQLYTNRVFNGLDTQADQLLTGVLLAVVVITAFRDGWVATLGRWLSVAFWPACAGLLVAVVFWPEDDQTIVIRVGMSLVALFSAVVIGKVYLSASSWQGRLLALPMMRYIGRRSYGLYLWHYPVFAVVLYAAQASGPSRYFLMPVALAVSFVFAEMSYRWVERPFLRVKDRLAWRESKREQAA